MKKVKVTADPAGNVVIPSKNNPEYGHIRVEQARMVVDDRGFAREKVITALIPGTIKDLKGFGWAKDQEVEGKIISKEQLTPFNTKDPERDYKVAGKTEIVCCIDGQPIYRKTFYSTSEKAEDVNIRDEHGNIVSHTNGEEIKAAYKALSEKATKRDAGKGKAAIDKE